MAQENPSWGYTTIRGALYNLGHVVARETVRNILKENGIEPAPERSKRMPWSTFLKSHWDCIAAADLFTVEIWSSFGLVRYYVLFFIRLSTRRVHVAGITPQPHAGWIKQIARNLTDPVDEFLLGIRYLIMDRDAIFTAEFRSFMKNEGVKVVRLPARLPNLNAYAERFVRTIKESCLGRMIFFGEDSLRRAISEFVGFYHHERNHQGLGNRLIDPREEFGLTDGPVACRERLGGLLRYYYRQAAQPARKGICRQSREGRARGERSAPHANRFRLSFPMPAARSCAAIEFLDTTGSKIAEPAQMSCHSPLEPNVKTPAAIGRACQPSSAYRPRSSDASARKNSTSAC
ncbi:MAG: transposase [Phycisphaerales bacterium]|nr:MAG: transposase [Phycisphaerales bacterium]